MGVGVKGNVGFLIKMKYSAYISATFLRKIGLENLYRERCWIDWLVWEEWNVFSANTANYYGLSLPHGMDLSKEI